jgi:transcriptional regulator NrdR family protein
MAMTCPYCKTLESRVVRTVEVFNDSLDAINIIRRRRECTVCHVRWTTEEHIRRIMIDEIPPSTF